MNQLMIRLYKSQDDYPISEFSFWNGGKQAVHHEETGWSDDPQYVDQVYNEGEWEIVSVPVEVKAISWEKNQADIALRAEAWSKASNLIYTGEYDENSFPLNAFVKKYPYTSDEFRVMSEARDKYRKQAQEGIEIENKKELEPYGFDTQSLIEQCLFEEDYRKTRSKFIEDYIQSRS